MSMDIFCKNMILLPGSYGKRPAQASTELPEMAAPVGFEPTTYTCDGVALILMSYGAEKGPGVDAPGPFVS